MNTPQIGQRNTRQRAAVVETLRTSTQMGPKVREMEAGVSRLFDKTRGIMVNSGSSANYIAMEILGLQPGDEVLLPTPYWPLIRGIIRSRGAVPVEVPLWTRLSEPGFDPVAALSEAITPRTVALAPTCVMGSVPDMAGIMKGARKHKLKVVEDILDGLERAPEGLIDLLAGGNRGKRMIRVGPDPA